MHINVQMSAGLRRILAQRLRTIPQSLRASSLYTREPRKHGLSLARSFPYRQFLYHGDPSVSFADSSPIRGAKRVRRHAPI